ncbi:MAG: DUF4911 domain-containing protein [Desulfosarcinaceae bacterium]
MEAQHWRYRVDRRRIAFLKFIIESYDNLALLTTLDARAGTIQLQVPPGCEATVRELLADLADSMILQPLE